MITIITGPMFASKSKRLIQYLTGAMVRDIPTLALKPKQDDRTQSSSIYSYDGSAFPALEIEEAIRPEGVLPIGKHLLAIDEVQFLSHEAVGSLCRNYSRSESWLLLSGLREDSEGNPFGPLPHIIGTYYPSVGVWLEELTARCSFCHGEATRTYCKVEKDGQVLVGRDIYEPRCQVCWMFGGKT